MILDGEINKSNEANYQRFFNDKIALGYTKEKTHLKRFIYRLIKTYRLELQGLREKINYFVENRTK